jgi:hypothetical protein
VASGAGTVVKETLDRDRPHQISMDRIAKHRHRTIHIIHARIVHGNIVARLFAARSGSS